MITSITACLYSRPIEREIEEIKLKFAKKPELAAANSTSLLVGFAYAESTEMFATTFQVRESAVRPGKYRSITGNQAAALGFVAVSELSGTPLFLLAQIEGPDMLAALGVPRAGNVGLSRAPRAASSRCAPPRAAAGSPFYSIAATDG